MINYKIILVVFLSTFAVSASDKGNGGDIVRCVLANQKVEYRTLDSIMMEQNVFFERKEYSSRESALETITTKLESVLPLMGQRLVDFRESFINKHSREKNIYWIETEVREINDEKLYAKIPGNCGEPIQAIIRVSKGNLIRYYYNQSLLDLIENEKFEMSWMIVHEYLRAYIVDADLIRLVNGYLHSNDFLSDNAIGVKNQLIDLGFDHDNRELILKESYDIEQAKEKKLASYFNEWKSIVLELRAFVDEYKGLPYKQWKAMSRTDLKKLSVKMNNLTNRLHKVQRVAGEVYIVLAAVSQGVSGASEKDYKLTSYSGEFPDELHSLRMNIEAHL